MAMLKKHKDLLDKNRLFLVREIKLTDDFYAYLQQENIVTSEMAEEIKADIKEKSRIGKFLDLIQRRGANAFRALIIALVETKQNHVARKLDPNLTAEIEKTMGDTSESSGSSSSKKMESRITQPTDEPVPSPSRNQLQPTAAKKKTIPVQAIDEHGNTPKAKEKTPTQASSGTHDPIPVTAPGKTPTQPSSESTQQSSGQCTDADISVIIDGIMKHHKSIFICELLDEYRSSLKVEKPANLFGSNGLCYILSHSPIDGQKDVASSFDVVNLSQLFDELNSRSFPVTFSSHLEMENEVKGIIENEKLREADSLTVLLFAIGFNGNVLGVDNKAITIQEILTLFSPENCPALINRAKHFIVHLVNPASEDKPDAKSVNSESNLANSQTNPVSPDAKLVKSFENLTLESLDTSFEFFNGDSYADMSLLYAESPSFNELSENSPNWLPWALNVSFIKFAHKFNVSTILEKVTSVLKQQKGHFTCIHFTDRLKNK